MVSPFNVACLQGGPMRVLQTVLALLLMLVLGYATTSPVSAVTIEESASGDLIATLEKARDVREQADIKIRENLKLMASSCLYMSDSLKELMALENQFEDRQIEDFTVGMADAVELELLDEESRKIKALYRRSHCDDPIILREQLRQADQKRKA